MAFFCFIRDPSYLLPAIVATSRLDAQCCLESKTYLKRAWLWRTMDEGWDQGPAGDGGKVEIININESRFDCLDLAY